MDGIKYNMETVDDDDPRLRHRLSWTRPRPTASRSSVWINPTRMHIVTHLSPKYEAMRTRRMAGRIEEAGMAQLDDDVGLVMQQLKDMGVDDNTIVVFTTDNGTETFTWPDGGQTPFAQCKGTVMEGGFRVPCILRWPGHIPADSVQNGIFSGLDWFPTFADAAGNPNITEELLKGVNLGDRTYKNHLDGYDQMAAIHRQRPFQSPRNLLPRRKHASARCALTTTSIASSTSPRLARGQDASGRAFLTNLRLDPFERTGWPNDGTKDGSQHVLRLVQVSILAFCVRPAGDGQGNPDVPRLPAHAAGREFQPRCRESGDGRQDGPGGSGGKGAEQLTGTDIQGGRLARAAQRICLARISTALQAQCDDRRSATGDDGTPST